MGNEIKWADVGHMYSQSEIMVLVDHTNGLEGGAITRLSPKGEDLSIYTDGRRGDGWIIKPILRHRDDMTEEEAKQLFQCSHGNMHFKSSGMGYTYKTELDYYKGEYFRKQQWWVQWRPMEFIWLTSNGFDIFGLIESGQAIRKEVSK